MQRHWWILWAVIAWGSAYAQLGGPAQTAQSPKAQSLPLSGRTQSGTVVPLQAPALGPGGTNSVNSVTPSVEVQGAYSGSVPNGTVSAGPIQLSLEQAIKRAIRFNLGTIGSGEAARQARAQRLAAIAELLPDVTGSVRESVQKVNLAAQGLRIQLPIPGFQFPTVVGPFNYFDARAFMKESLSFTSLYNLRASEQNARSAEYSVQDSRDLVLLAVTGAYLQISTTAARAATTKAQVDSATAVYDQAVDRNKSGLAAHIDVNRALVELQTQQARYLALSAEFEKEKLMLARLIGLPMAQPFVLSDVIPRHEIAEANVDELIRQSWARRADVQAASLQVKASEAARKAAIAEYLPSLGISGDYGVIGITPTNEAHGTFTAAAAVQFPIFRSGRIRADIDQASAALNQRKAESEDIKAKAEQDVRVGVLDLATASQQLKVAESNRTLAQDTLQQARDRFHAGVSDTVELVQAEELVAAAEQDYISALYALNLAQVSLARAVGDTEQGITRLLRGN